MGYQLLSFDLPEHGERKDDTTYLCKVHNCVKDLKQIIEYANKGGNIGVEQFEKQRMDEKIKSLHDFLPPFIVEHSSIYGILSKGIHELLEKECLDYFDTMRVSIEMILDQRIEIRERQKKEEVVKKEIDAITENLKNRYGTR